jgi:hypothetical protein
MSNSTPIQKWVPGIRRITLAPLLSTTLPSEGLFDADYVPVSVDKIPTARRTKIDWDSYLAAKIKSEARFTKNEMWDVLNRRFPRPEPIIPPIEEVIEPIVPVAELEPARIPSPIPPEEIVVEEPVVENSTPMKRDFETIISEFELYHTQEILTNLTYASDNLKEAIEDSDLLSSSKLGWTPSLANKQSPVPTKYKFSMESDDEDEDEEESYTQSYKRYAPVKKKHEQRGGYYNNNNDEKYSAPDPTVTFIDPKGQPTVRKKVTMWSARRNL